MSITNYTFSTGELPSLLSFLVTSPTLKLKLHHLSIQNCIIKDKECRLIAYAISKLPNLHSLTLKNNEISSIGAMALFTRIWEFHSNLKITSINLDGNQIGPEGALSLSQSLPLLEDLKSLSIADNPIMDSGAYYILKSLLNQKRKSYLNFPCPEEIKVVYDVRQYFKIYFFFVF